MLEAGVAREVARGVLPVNIYSSMYVTMNARALMNFLSLRTKREGTVFPSYPQREIEMVAEQMEEWFAVENASNLRCLQCQWKSGSVMDWKDVLGKVLIIQFMYALTTYLVDNSFDNWLKFIAIPIIYYFFSYCSFFRFKQKIA